MNSIKLPLKWSKVESDSKKIRYVFNYLKNVSMFRLCRSDTKIFQPMAAIAPRPKLTKKALGTRDRDKFFNDGRPTTDETAVAFDIFMF